MKGSNTEQHKALMRIHVRRMVCLKQHLSHSAQAQSAYEHPVRKMMHLKQHWDCYQIAHLGSWLMTKNRENSHQVLDSLLGYYLCGF